MMDVSVPCPSDFVVERLIGRGCYSFVYEIRKTTGFDSGSKYALKRFLLENDSAIKCVLRERRILERLALCDFQSPFLPMLCYSMWKNYSSAFVLREGSGCDLYDLLCHVGCLSESNTRFYIAEIICGLEHLHSLSIVHLDVKPENILFYPDGHVFVSDLDRSYDISQNIKPTLDDFTGTPLFMAPEVARGEAIDTRSDIWSLGVLVAEMVTGPIRREAENTAEEFKRARMGTYNIRGLKRLSKPLQSFFSACLQRQHTQRPYLKGVKELRFLKCVDWCKAGSRLLRPPYSTSELRHRLTKEDNTSVSSTDVNLLSGAFKPWRPVKFNSKMSQSANTGDSEPGDIPSSLKKAGYTEEKLDLLFNSFNFIHPSLRSSATDTGVSDSLSKLTVKLDTAEGLVDSIPNTKHSKGLISNNSVGPIPFRRPRSRGTSIGD
ncbi:Serine/threonine-protein kinase 32A [Schistosoma haematobium]|uniref:Serine/threonine-protein kinase 32A n=2 Tax=Schistosoma haematobium TaxID=6185 RepID=A0A6A5D7Y9_SCHHA|nr:Serine/threonine-protein kinase 32A [Schistosoma haematobium]KAH9584857.1 Serine/threonine-protein kinase 32A [Schistosoma haematobium]